jgi:hypothetical protein
MILASSAGNSVENNGEIYAILRGGERGAAVNLTTQLSIIVP